MIRQLATRVAALLLLHLLAGAAAASAEQTTPIGLRLAQVVVRLPTINLYAEAQDEHDNPVPFGDTSLTALVGTESLPLQPANDGKDAHYPGTTFVFAIDVSGSMGHGIPDGNGQTKFDLERLTLNAWIDQMRPQDRAAIITIGSTVTQRLDFTSSKTELAHSASLMALQSGPADDDRTMLYEGLVRAIDLDHRLDRQLPLRRAIVVLTDGVDDEMGGAGRQEVADKLAVDPVPIYMLAIAPPTGAADESGVKDAAALARLSGGAFIRIHLSRQLNDAYLKLVQIERSTQHFTLTCAACLADGSQAAVRVFWDSDQRLSSQTVTVRMVGADGSVPPHPQSNPKPAPAQPVQPARPAVVPPPPVKQPSWLGPLSVLAKVGVLGTVPVLWLGLAIFLLCGAICALMVIVLERSKKRGRPPVTEPPLPATGAQTGVTVAGGTMVVASHVAVTPSMSGGGRRLRLFPLGHNDLQPFDVMFEGPLTIGRDPACDICISDDLQVSGRHCRLTPAGRRILVEDTGSRNGTRINGVPLTSALHAETDAVLGAGRTELRLMPLDGAA
jgi:Mg-chelatase subunit ChlD